jgi:hypothetical protein
MFVSADRFAHKDLRVPGPGHYGCARAIPFDTYAAAHSRLGESADIDARGTRLTIDITRGYHRMPWRCTSIEAISMRAMVLAAPRTPLEWMELPDRSPGPDEIGVKVSACGICRTDLHVIDGELARLKLPLVPGHEVVGRIDALGAHVDSGLKLGDRVGIPWLAHTCGVCSYCIHGHENLCDDSQFTGYTRDGEFVTPVLRAVRNGFRLL